MNVRFCHSFHDEQTDCILFIARTETNPIDIWLKLVREDAWSAVLNRVKSRSNNDTLHTLNIWTKHLESVLLSGLLPQQLLQSRFYLRGELENPSYCIFSKSTWKQDLMLTWFSDSGILTGKKHPKIKLQRLRKIRMLTFGSVVGPFCSRHSICFNIYFWQSSFEWKWCVFNLSGFN